MGGRVDHTPPEPGVTEIRVHGVGGANPSTTLGRTDIQQVTGDATAGFFRVSNPTHANRTVEAYSWGGLTARSRTRAMWVLLVPFALVNLAGWMVEPIPRRKRQPGDPRLVGVVVWAANSLEKAQRFLVHLTSLALTGAYVMWVALMSTNLLAYQCGTQPDCAAGRFYAEFFQGQFFVDHPGRRIVVGALVPLGLLVLFAVISVVSRARYESYTEDRQVQAGAAAGVAKSTVDEAGPPILSADMGDPTFWHTALWHTRLFRAHVAFALAFLSGISSYAAWQFIDHVPGESTAAPVRGIAIVLFGASIVLALAVVEFVRRSVWREEKPHAVHNAGLVRNSNWILRVALALTATALVNVWQLRGTDETVWASPAFSDLWGFGWTPVLLFAAAILIVLLFSLVEIAKWTVTCQVDPPLFFIAIAGVMILAWPYAWIVALVAAAIGIPARYVEVKLCRPESISEPAVSGQRACFSPRREWIEIGVATVGLLVLQLVGSKAWPDTVWGNEWPRLTPVVITAALNFLFFFRYLREVRVQEQEARHGQSQYGVVALGFPAVVSAILLSIGVVVWLLVGRIDVVYVVIYVAWVVTSFFWVAIKPSGTFRWNGPGAVALLAVSLTAGLFSGGLIRFASMLSGEGYELRTIELYDWITVGFVAVFASALVALIAWFLFTRATAGVEAMARIVRMRSTLEAAGTKPAPPKIAGKVQNWITLARGVEAIDVFIMHISMVTLYAAMALVVHFWREGVGFTKFLDQPVGTSWEGLVNASAWVTLMVVLGGLLAVRSGLRDQGFRRQIGIIWDVTSFWPRHFHPFAPPSYAVRTVPELQQRLTEIGEGGATVLSGHSQGSVVAFAAAASVAEPVAKNLALVTHGSPLRRFYARFFPKFFPDDLIDATARRIGRDRHRADGSWLNFFRATDPIGQPIFRDVAQTDCDVPILDPQADRPSENMRCIGDVELHDPPSLNWQQHQGPPDVLWHISYMSDPFMAAAVDGLAASWQDSSPSGDG
ncbi:MAG: hypothetical protein GY926_26720 [bacterium]|nr:hypothetical protein [bacterium]